MTQDDNNHTPISQPPSSSPSKTEEPSSITPPEAWGGERLSDKFLRPPRQQPSLPSRFATMTSSTSTSSSLMTGLQDVSLASVQLGPTSAGLPPIANLRLYENSTLLSQDKDSPLASLSIKGSLEFPTTTTPTRRFSSYAERISNNSSTSFGDGTVGSPRISNREEILSGLTPRHDTSSSSSPAAMESLNVSGLVFDWYFNVWRMRDWIC